MTMGLIKVYLTTVPGSTKLRKQQQHVIDTLESLKIPFERVDISDPCREEDRKFMRSNSKGHKEGATPLPPQIFNDDGYCGDYTKFANSMEADELYEFLKLENPNKTAKASVTITEEEEAEEKEKVEEEEPEEVEKEQEEAEEEKEKVDETQNSE